MLLMCAHECARFDGSSANYILPLIFMEHFHNRSGIWYWKQYFVAMANWPHNVTTLTLSIGASGKWQQFAYGYIEWGRWLRLVCDPGLKSGQVEKSRAANYET